MKSTSHNHQRRFQKHYSGFTLLEVLIAMVILSVGMLSMLAMLATALTSGQTVQEDMIARQLASEGLEGVYTARNTAQIQWSQIQNAANGGIFLNGLQPLLNEGPDGIPNTADDGTLPGVPAQLQMTTPGPDGILGTGDDVIVPLTNYQRQVQVLPVNLPNGTINQNLRQIVVTVRYYTPLTPAAKNYTVNGFVSAFR